MNRHVRNENRCGMNQRVRKVIKIGDRKSEGIIFNFVYNLNAKKCIFSKKQRQFPTSRFSKKSKKKRKHDYDSDPDAPRKPKVKRPRIQFGGLNDSDEDETLGRRTRGKKMNYLDVLDTDSEEVNL